MTNTNENKTCKDCIHSGLCYKENDYSNFPDKCGSFISDWKVQKVQEEGRRMKGGTDNDLEKVRKKIDELVGYAWERGYKCGQAEHEEQVKKDPEFHVGDVVYYSNLIHSKCKGIIIGLLHLRDIKDPEFPRVEYASVYTREFDVPQIISLTDLTPTGQHVNVLDFFNKAFIDISRGEEK